MNFNKSSFFRTLEGKKIINCQNWNSFVENVHRVVKLNLVFARDNLRIFVVVPIDSLAEILRRHHFDHDKQEHNQLVEEQFVHRMMLELILVVHVVEEGLELHKYVSERHDWTSLEEKMKAARLFIIYYFNEMKSKFTFIRLKRKKIIVSLPVSPCNGGRRTARGIKPDFRLSEDSLNDVIKIFIKPSWCCQTNILLIYFVGIYFHFSSLIRRLATTINITHCHWWVAVEKN